MRRPDRRLAARVSQVAEKFSQEPPIVVVYWNEVENDSPDAGSVEHIGNVCRIDASSREQFDHARHELEQRLAPCRMICIVPV